MARRPRHKMPDDVAQALAGSGTRGSYDARPPYQRNDYIGWIEGAKRPEARSRRIRRMTDELKRGDVYMSMAWRGGSSG